MAEIQVQVSKVIYKYEYWFETTPRYKVADETWELHDVFLKRLDTGDFVFVPVFSKKVEEPTV